MWYSIWNASTKTRFQTILERIASKIPGIKTIKTHPTEDNRLLLRFNDGAFKDPFYAQQMSDGTLKIFAYLLCWKIRIHHHSSV